SGNSVEAWSTQSSISAGRPSNPRRMYSRKVILTSRYAPPRRRNSIGASSAHSTYAWYEKLPSIIDGRYPHRDGSTSSQTRDRNDIDPDGAPRTSGLFA